MKYMWLIEYFNLQNEWIVVTKAYMDYYAAEHRDLSVMLPTTLEECLKAYTLNAAHYPHGHYNIRIRNIETNVILPGELL